MSQPPPTALLHDAGPDAPPPALSVVLVTPDRFETIRRTVGHLAAQAVRDRIEVVIVAPTLEAIGDAGPGELSGFRRAVCVAADGPIRCVERASVPGIRAASAPVVALVEDHAFPAPGWAEAILDAHRGPWAAVGPAMANANPRSSLSWASLMIAYGRWVDPDRGGEVDAVPGHNVTYKRDRLLELDDRLEGLVGREGTLHRELRDRGGRFYLEPRAGIAHLNPSRIVSTIVLRVQAGWLYGAMRARRAGWSPLKRLLYIAGAPLIPPVRYIRIRRELFDTPPRRALLARIRGGLAFGLILDGIGQAIGYAIGPGRTRERLSAFEIDRIRHLSRRDRRELAESEVPAPSPLARDPGREVFA